MTELNIKAQFELPVKGMTASEARAILQTSKTYQADLEAAIATGERSLRAAIESNKTKFRNGLHARNRHLWDDGIKHWESLGFRIEWRNNKGHEWPGLCSF